LSDFKIRMRSGAKQRQASRSHRLFINDNIYGLSRYTKVFSRTMQKM